MSQWNSTRDRQARPAHQIPAPPPALYFLGTAAGILTIVSLAPLSLLPTFAYACTYQPAFLRVYLRHLRALGFPLPADVVDAVFQRYLGDTSGMGKGELLVRVADA